MMSDEVIQDDNLFDDDGYETLESNKYSEIKAVAPEVVVFSTDWTTETIINQINKNNIDLNPAFQRRNAWLNSRKSKFIESLFLGLPVPQIVLAESNSQKGKFIVIDGKQRLLSIFQFSQSGSTFEELKLQELEILTSLNGKTRENLENPGLFPELVDVELASFDNQPIRTVIIRNWKSDLILYEIFLRLNQGSVPLSPQELRQALLPGHFTSFIDKASSESKVVKSILGIKRPDRRMRDAELLLRYFAFKNFITDYSGNLKDFFDTTVKYFNMRWSESQELIQNQIAEFEQAHETATYVFGPNNAYKKWSISKFEPRINRALFDVIMYYFSDKDISEKIRPNRDKFIQIFKDESSSDYEFQQSIERTTKSIDSTDYRFKKFAEILSSAIGEKISPPTINKKK